MLALPVATLIALTTLGSVSDTGPADRCADRRTSPGGRLSAVVVLTPVKARDTVATASVCVMRPRASTTRIGSYHGELYFDSTAASVVRVERPADGLRVENTTLAGRVNFAGAAPTGFSSGALVHVLLRMKTPGAVPRLRLRMLELNAVDGSSLMKTLATPATSP